ncbi:hypothetical protein N7478_004148 [Penicillium angulare]|uniref:uncharacterized protein n=1 Tax=Penicillium angulare TaxID=116970 RepID=UPI002540F44A|nr:uncharacterized protein N7478_004148 [Penicillium angulare]KAJ5278776.1 hypothetical protein N7478_004148 [Penicillium angulare]
MTLQACTKHLQPNGGQNAPPAYPRAWMHPTDLPPFDGAIDQLELEGRARGFTISLQIPPAARLLPSHSVGTIRSDLLRLTSAVVSDDFDPEPVKPLLKVSLNNASTDDLTWSLVDAAVAEPTPFRTIVSSL